MTELTRSTIRVAFTWMIEPLEKWRNFEHSQKFCSITKRGPLIKLNEITIKSKRETMSRRGARWRGAHVPGEAPLSSLFDIRDGFSAMLLFGLLFKRNFSCVYYHHKIKMNKNLSNVFEIIEYVFICNPKWGFWRKNTFRRKKLCQNFKCEL